jgi:hypothetical protein
MWEIPGGVLLSTGNSLFRFDGSRVTSVPSADTGRFKTIHRTSGTLLLGADKGLFRFDGGRVTAMPSDDTGAISDISQILGGLYVSAEKGLFRFDGSRVTAMPGDDTGAISDIRPIPGGFIVNAEKGLFRFDGSRVTHVPGDNPGKTGFMRQGPDRRSVYSGFMREIPGGLFLYAEKGLFRFDGSRVTSIPSDDTGIIQTSQEIPGGLLLGAEKGLFRFDGSRVLHVPGDDTGAISDIRPIPGGMLLLARKSLFRFDGSRVISVPGDDTGDIDHLHEVPGGVLLVAGKGLFQFDGSRVIHVPGDGTEDIKDLRKIPGGTLLGASKELILSDGSMATHASGDDTGEIKGTYQIYDDVLLKTDDDLFLLISEPLSSSNTTLSNRSDLIRIAPSQNGILTNWTMIHPCAGIADKLNLYVVGDNGAGKTFEKRAIGFEQNDGAVSFEATVPVPDVGDWTFRVVSKSNGTVRNVGKPSDPVPFIIPGIVGWLTTWWQTIAGSAVAILAVLNLLVFAAARYSATAWSLATDAAWGKTALLPQMLLLRYWRGAQLWLLDLYFQGQRRALLDMQSPFLPLPLIGPNNSLADSDTVLVRFGSVRHVWVQGGTGMGKTSIFRHLIQQHFGRDVQTSLSAFRRDGYILVPIEARRFPEINFDERGASAWVISSALSVLSERNLSFTDRGLLRSMLNSGTVAIVVDGLNEVARGPAVDAFATEFPKAPVLVTSQESGEQPFEVWRLPRQISDHVDGLLTLYLGQQKGELLARRLRNTGLFQHLRSGYDVRLVIQLAEADPGGAKLPNDRLGLYREVVAAAWPVGDDRLNLLQAAAWKLISERGPNEDKRRLKPDVDAPKDLLEALASVRERSGRSVRLIRPAPPSYEFVHDQMNAYLAAAFLSGRATLADMRELLVTSKAWQDGGEAQRTLWGFVAFLLNRPELENLWVFAGDDERRAVLGRALAERAEREGWSLMRPPANAPVADSAPERLAGE